MLKNIREPLLKLFPAILVFCLCLMLGVVISQAKPLWNDELYTQTHILETVSYKDIVSGKFEEGNNHPLFYLLQKGFCQILGYKFPVVWNGEWNLADLKSQFLLRVLPNVFMSLSVALMFYFFSRSYGWAAGVYVVLLGLTSEMMLLYWAEARPYGLWVFLTTVQSLLLLDSIRKDQRGTSWKGLGLVHVLLALTVSLSMLQITAAGVILCLRQEKKLKQHLALGLISILIALYYYLNSPRFPMSFSGPRLSPVLENFSWDRLIMIFLFLAFTPAFFREKGNSQPGLKHFSKHKDTGFLVFFLITVCLSFLSLAWLALKDQGMPNVFTVTKRYFIYLTPLQIIATAFISVTLWQAFAKQKVLQHGLIMLIVGLFVLHTLQLSKSIPFPSWTQLFHENGDAKHRAMAATMNHLLPSSFEPLREAADHPLTMDKKSLEPFLIYFERVSEYMPERAEGHNLLGFCALAHGQTHKARIAFQRAFILKPDMLCFAYNLGVMAYELGQYEVSAQLMERALQSPMQKNVSFISSSRIYRPLIKSRKEPAKEIVSHVRETYLNAYKVLALADLKLNRYKKALGTAQAAMARGLGAQDFFFSISGQAALGLGQYDQAAAFFQQSLNWNSGNPEALSGLSRAYQALGKTVDSQAVHDLAEKLRRDLNAEKQEKFMPSIY